MKRYELFLTDYTTNSERQHHTIDAENADTAWTEACKLLDPSETHTIGGSFYVSKEF